MKDGRRSADTKDVNRRDVLKATGAAAGLNLDNSQIFENISSSDKVAEIHFVETALTYPDAPDYPMGYNDDYVRYAIDSQKGDLVFNSATKTATIDRVKSNNALLRSQADFYSLPTTLFGSATRSIVKETGYRLHTAKTVRLEESYQQPEIQFEKSGDSVKVHTDSSSTTVSPGSITSTTLPQQEITIQRRGEVTKEIPDPRKPDDTKKVRESGKIETVTVTPELTVHNNGILDAYQKE